jgi:hypothetical protein
MEGRKSIYTMKTIYKITHQSPNSTENFEFNFFQFPCYCSICDLCLGLFRNQEPYCNQICKNKAVTPCHGVKYPLIVAKAFQFYIAPSFTVFIVLG